MTAATEIILMVGAVIFSIFGLAYALAHKEEVSTWFRNRRLEKSRRFGYLHRSSGMEFSAFFFKTEEERSAYREGWMERQKDESLLGVDDLGSVGVPSSSKTKKAKK